MVEEIKCKCNQCKHIWHYLEEDEKLLKRQKFRTSTPCGMCNPLGGVFALKHESQRVDAFDKFNKCPKCGSGDINKTEHSYEKKY